MAESNGLLNRQGVKALGGSNPPRSTMEFYKTKFKPLVDSSFITACAWDPNSQSLMLIFLSGSMWLYYGVPEQIYNDLATAPSAGKYFNSNIRNKFEQKCIYKQGSTVG